MAARACGLKGGSVPGKKPFAAIDKLEPALAKAGVQARWIQVVDDGGNPLVENPYLPCPYSAEVRQANEKLLTQWVEEIHRSGMSAMSWFSLSYCPRANELHPDWRQVSILPWPNAGSQHGHLLRQQPLRRRPDRVLQLGDRAIQAGRDLVRRLLLDAGLGTSLCRSPAAALRARRSSRRRPAWRFPRKSIGPIRRSAGGWPGGTRRSAATSGDWPARYARHIRTRSWRSITIIVFDAPWYSGVPLDRYAADIISGSEAYTAETVDLTMRLCRAYGRSQSEVWRRFDVGPDPQTGVGHLLEHALVCYAAGGQPSFGGSIRFAGRTKTP